MAWDDGEADILSNSWGFVAQGANFDEITFAINRARTQGRDGLGSIVVFASGNSNQNFSGVTFPANVNGVITVGAINRNGNIWNYSSRGPQMDLVAPSGNVGGNGDVVTTDRMGNLGYDNGNHTDTFGGTSAAAPQVSGVAVLMVSVNPNLTEAQVRTILQQTATDMGPSGFDNTFGFGRLNAQAAIQAAMPTVTGPPAVCTGGTQFTLNDILPGTQVTWSVSPTSLFTGNTSGNGVTANLTPSGSSGQATLTYTVTTDCGNVQINRSFWVGKPAMPPTPGVLVNVPPNRFTVSLTPPTEQGVTSYNRYVDGILQSGEHNATIRIPWTHPFCGNSYLVGVEAVNACGTSARRTVTLFNPPCFTGYSLRIFPNPGEAEVEIAVIGVPNEGMGKTIGVGIMEDLEGVLVIYDQMGAEMHWQPMKGGQTRVNVQGLKPGPYVVKVFADGEVLEGKLLKN